MAVSVVIQVIFYFGELFAFFVTYRKVKFALGIMLEFHDYLIEYRLTPRSRILRKHLPKMTMVLEEESNMDQSSIMMSQSRIMSQHTKTSQQCRKFVYSGEHKRDESGNIIVDQSNSDEISEGSDSGSQEDLETDLLAFDKE